MKLYKILDRHDVELPPKSCTGEDRTVDEAKRLVKALNKNGKSGPYKIEEIL